MKTKEASQLTDRLLYVIEFKKLGSKSALADEIGVTPSAVYSAIKRGEITTQMALAIQGALGISAKWLQEGDEPIEAPPKLSLGFKMVLEMVSQIQQLGREVPNKLAQLWFSEAWDRQKRAFHALAWKVRGQDLFDNPGGNWAFSIEVKDPESFSKFSKQHANLENKQSKVSRLLFDAKYSNINETPWNIELFDKQLNLALQCRVFADLKDSKSLEQWNKETAHFSEKQREALDEAYHFLLNLKMEAEQIFQPNEFGKNYAIGMLFDEDRQNLSLVGGLTKKLIEDFWFQKINSSELARVLRKSKYENSD